MQQESGSQVLKDSKHHTQNPKPGYGPDPITYHWSVWAVILLERSGRIALDFDVCQHIILPSIECFDKI